MQTGSAWYLLHVIFLVGLLLGPEDSGDMFLRNVRRKSTTTRRYILAHPTAKRNLFPFSTYIRGVCMTACLACVFSNLVHQPRSNHDKQKREGAEGKGRSLVVGIRLLCLHTTPSSPPPSLFYPYSSVRGDLSLPGETFANANWPPPLLVPSVPEPPLTQTLHTQQCALC